MGEAKRRGTLEQRKEQAIAEGRSKAPPPLPDVRLRRHYAPRMSLPLAAIMAIAAANGYEVRVPESRKEGEV